MRSFFIKFSNPGKGYSSFGKNRTASAADCPNTMKTGAMRIEP